jgi:hypothetical protein
MEIIKVLLDSVDLIAKILGFLSLYAIAIALLDWRKTCKYEQQCNDIKNGPK